MNANHSLTPSGKHSSPLSICVVGSPRWWRAWLVFMRRDRATSLRGTTCGSRYITPFFLLLLTTTPCLGASARQEPLALYVATDGDDAWSGQRAVPSPQRDDGPFATLEGARNAIRELKRQGPLPFGGIVVEVGDGIHELARPLLLEQEDSGAEEAPIVYRGRTGAAARLVGGRVIRDWRPASDPTVLGQLDPKARGHIVQANLNDAGIADMGEVKPGPRWGRSEPGLELFFQGRPMTLARWPNHGFTLTGRVLGPTPVDGGGDNGCREGIFSYEGDHPRRWNGATDIILHGFWARDWADQRLRVAAIDTEKRIITLDAEPRHEFGFRPAHRYYAYNILAELDEPGEWYLDRRSGTLYFWPPAAWEHDPPAVSVLPHLVIMKDVAHVTLRGLTLECCRDTAVRVENALQTRIIGCVIRNTGNAGVSMTGRESGVVGCDLHDLAGGGISLSGGDRRTLTPAGLFIDNCHLYAFGRWNPINNPGATVAGVGNRITHSLFHDAPHMAVMWSGNDHVFEFNEFHSVVQGSNDAGIMYAGFDPTSRGHVIRYNYFHDVFGFEGRGCNGVYLDDMFCSATIFGNLFCKVPRAAFIGGGHDNVVANNIFVDCRPSVHVDARMLGWAAGHKETMKERLAAVPFREEPWRSRYPELLTYLDGDFAEPRNNLIARNICWGGRWADIEPRARPGVQFKDNMTEGDPCFIDAAARDFRLRPESPAWKLGFERIPVESIGPYASDERASWPIHHVPQREQTPKLDVSLISLRFVLSQLHLSFASVTLLAALALATWAGLHYCDSFPLSRIVWALLLGFRIGIGFLALALIAQACSTRLTLPGKRDLWPALMTLVAIVELSISSTRRWLRRHAGRRRARN